MSIIVISFDTSAFGEDMGLVAYLIESIQSNCQRALYDYIDSITDDCFEIQEELDLEIDRLTKLIETSLPVLADVIIPLTKSGVFSEESYIYEACQFGKDTILLTENFDYRGR